MSMFIAMNRFKVLKGAEHDFEQVWLTRETHLRELPGFYRVPPVERPRARGPRPLLIAHHVALARRLRGVDQVRAIPQGARSRRRQQAALRRASRIRGLHRAAGRARRRLAARGGRVRGSRATWIAVVEERPPVGGARLPPAPATSWSRSPASTASAPSRWCAICRPSSVPSSPARLSPTSCRTSPPGARSCSSIHNADIVLECTGTLPAGSIRARLLQYSRRQPDRRPHQGRQLQDDRLHRPRRQAHRRCRCSSTMRPATRCSRSSCGATMQRELIAEQVLRFEALRARMAPASQ